MKQITMGAAERAIIISDAEIILVEIIRWLGKSNTHTHEFLFKSLLRKPWSCTLIFYSWSIFVGYEFSIYALERAWELLWWSAHQIDVCQRIMIISENYSPREREVRDRIHRMANELMSFISFLFEFKWDECPWNRIYSKILILMRRWLHLEVCGLCFCYATIYVWKLIIFISMRRVSRDS